MATLTETLETIRAEEASVQSLFGGDGSRVRDRRKTPEYLRQLSEAARFVAEVGEGHRPVYHLREAMTTSDFPLLFADILDRQLLASYRETQPVWQAYCHRSTVPDFRSVKRFAVDGAEGVLDEVHEREEYPEKALSETADTYSVKKYGRRLDLSWEMMINDDLQAFTSGKMAARLARAARRSEQKFATTLYVDANGPHASLYTAGYANIVNATNAGSPFTAVNPALSIAALQQAMVVMAKMVDADGEPIVVDMVTLVVPPALEITAQNILNALQLNVVESGGTTNQTIWAQNWMRGRVTLVVDPYIPIVASTANGGTSWFLFANPDTSRPAIEIGFLRGNEEPALYERAPNARRVAGGDVPESFEEDSIAYRVRHVFGGTRLTTTGGAKATVASNGSGA